VADCDGCDWLNMGGPLVLRCCACGVARDASLYLPPPRTALRAHTCAEIRCVRRVSGCEDGRRKSAKIWPKGSENWWIVRARVDLVGVGWTSGR
jgi:hypothetical protein